VITPVLQAAGIFNICKLKTHSFMAFTGAVKNNFGVIPGLHKPGYHAKLHDTGRFANMLLDLAAYVAPRVSIMDAVVGMEGDGPGAGTPREVGLLLGSKNPLALDVVASEIIGLPRERNPILVAAEKRGLSPTRVEEVKIIGPAISELRIPNYKFPATLSEGVGFGDATWMQRLATRVFRNDMSLKPWVVKEKCIACGVCRDSCPVRAISVIQEKGEYAHIDYKHCIRCYCCHELCPEKAIELKGSFLYQKVMKA
jgi:ferredoxin